MFLKMHKRLFGVDAKNIGGDAGYAGTSNRDHCKENVTYTANVEQLADRIEKRAQWRPPEKKTCAKEAAT